MHRRAVAEENYHLGVPGFNTSAGGGAGAWDDPSATHPRAASGRHSGAADSGLAAKGNLWSRMDPEYRVPYIEPPIEPPGPAKYGRRRREKPAGSKACWGIVQW